MVVAVDCLPGPATAGLEGEGEGEDAEDAALRKEFAEAKAEFLEAFVARASPPADGATPSPEEVEAEAQRQLRRRTAEELLDPSRKHAVRLETVAKDLRKRLYELESEMRRERMAHETEVRRLEAAQHEAEDARRSQAQTI